ncbi:BTAD domain-containing putative transcriptional regulator [[Actinomadura] parvosata]|uniref:BTAD domain-containing putative transcriptional regulator n=1 Tax=[Actinomadura] parvosata TaxID=1955412 RepID=UPI00406D15C3
MLTFSVLGPLRAQAGHKDLDIGPKKQRIILGALLCHANNAVSRDYLVDVVWGESPPKSAQANLFQYISSLRRALRQADVIRTTTTGYVLSAAAWQTDWSRFNELVGQARRSRNEPEASLLYLRALTLWNGPAYADLTDVLQIRPEADRLNEVRVSAYQEYFELELTQGRHQEIIPDLSRVAAENPFNERFRHQLMTALYRAHRRTEALAVYAQTVALVRRELATEPGPQLQSLATQIGNESPSLTHHPKGPADATPAELPPPPEIVGRDRTLSLIADRLSADSPAPAVVAIAGMPGSGKSALAVHAAHSAAGQYVDGQLYLDFHTWPAGAQAPSAHQLLVRCLRSLGEDADRLDADAALAHYRSMTVHRRILIVLDNLADASAARTLLPTGRGSALIVTGQTDFSGFDGALQVRLRHLGPATSLALLERLIGEARVAKERRAAMAIAEVCAGLPVALRAVGARLRRSAHLSLAEFHRDLVRSPRLLDELTCDGFSVRATFGRIIQKALTEDRDGAGPLGSCISTDPRLGTVLRHSAELERLIDELLAAHLIRPAGDQVYAVHAMFGLCIREYLEQPVREKGAGVH